MCTGYFRIANTEVQQPYLDYLTFFFEQWHNQAKSRAGIASSNRKAGAFCEQPWPSQRAGASQQVAKMCYVTGQEAYDKLRSMAYNDVSAFLVCLSIVKPKNLDNVKAKWVPEIRKFCPNVPIVLVGTKVDLKNDPTVISRVARWYIFKPKIPVWVNFLGSCNGRSWYILQPFGIFYGCLVHLVVIWYIFTILVCCNMKNLATLNHLTVGRVVKGQLF
jgi:hypothetical protein